jgi:hypothetical protein
MAGSFKLLQPLHTVLMTVHDVDARDDCYDCFSGLVIEAQVMAVVGGPVEE